MQNFHMYLCDGCGYSREKPGICPYCQVPLTSYSKEDQAEYQVDMEEPMRVQDAQQWYV
ncbi:MAG: hypothetical protein P4L74_00375 [Candidatus Doudnabacteria bacterium]|nr:hypothetical protein [Candidatus Doudnabacteria bacterium]